MSESYRLPFDEAVDRLDQEYEATADAAVGSAQDAAHWWNRIMQLRAEPQGDTLLIEVDPDHVGQLLRNLFDEVLNYEVIGDPEMLAHYWRLLCPSKAEILYDESGDCADVVITEDDVAVDVAE